MSPTDAGMESRAEIADTSYLIIRPERGIRIYDYEIGSVFTGLEQLPAFIEYIVSIHILEDRSTTAAESLRAAREVWSKFRSSRELPVKSRREFGRLGAVVYVSHDSTHPVGLLVRAISPPALTISGAVGATLELQDAIFRYEDLSPQQTQQAREALERPRPSKSPWADAVGPLYTSGGIAAALDISLDQADELSRLGALMSLTTSDGQTLYPVAQIGRTGQVVRGLQWILRELDGIVDRYTLAAWLNAPSEELAGQSVWTALRDSEVVPSVVKELVRQFRIAAA
jgi:hypothetical protein